MCFNQQEPRVKKKSAELVEWTEKAGSARTISERIRKSTDKTEVLLIANC